MPIPNKLKYWSESEYSKIRIHDAIFEEKRENKDKRVSENNKEKIVIEI